MSRQQVLSLLADAPASEDAGGNIFFLADMIAGGLGSVAMQQVKAALELSDLELSAAIGMSSKTIGRLRKRPGATLSPAASDRLYRLAKLYSMAEDVLGSSLGARRWLRAPQPGLGGHRPLDLLKTEVGAREVENLLGRIEYGVLS